MPSGNPIFREPRRWGCVLAGSLLLYALLGFLVLPAVLRSMLPGRIGGLLGRPVTIELGGVSNVARALRQRGLEDQLRLLKGGARKVKIPPTPEEEVIEAAEREKWMRAAFDKAFPPPKDVRPEPPPLAEVEQRLLESIPVDPAELRLLAKARSRASIEALLNGGQVEADRIFEVQGGEPAKAGGARVHFALK